MHGAAGQDSAAFDEVWNGSLLWMAKQNVHTAQQFYGEMAGHVEVNAASDGMCMPPVLSIYKDAW